MRRAHKILLVGLLLLCVAMAAALIRLRNRAQDRLQEEATSAPAMAPAAGTPTSAVTLYVPNDLDGSLTTGQRSVPLPEDANARAKVLLETLVQAFNAPGSTHPMRVSQGINEVYLLPAPAGAGQTKSGDELAVVDLTSALAAAQPSGIEPETLTLEAMLATLHANMPEITEVHFLVDGQPRETLAGHADLTRTYMASEANPEPNPQSSPAAAP
ncbi:MAG TPA: GerMN domain-containing protein [Acidobacteriaceae bacterium]|nr:GerMN domain-containing protein [Acidobacteriaceae bacterium]